MFEGFVPLKSGKTYSIGSVNLARIFVSCRKLIVLVTWKIFGRNSGGGICFFPMEHAIAKEFWCL